MTSMVNPMVEGVVAMARAVWATSSRLKVECQRNSLIWFLLSSLDGRDESLGLGDARCVRDEKWDKGWVKSITTPEGLSKKQPTHEVCVICVLPITAPPAGSVVKFPGRMTV